MKTRFIILGILIFGVIGCSKPTYIGVKQEVKETVQLLSEKREESNLELHKRFMEGFRIPAAMLDELLKEQQVIVANYSQYPFISSKDSGSASYSKLIDNFLLTEIGIVLNKALLGRGVRVLENDPGYNQTILYNFDKASAQLNFEVLDYGIYYEQIAYDALIRHIKAVIRYRVVNSKGLLRMIDEKVYAYSDTIRLDDLPEVEKRNVTLGYPDAQLAKKLNRVGTPSLANEKIERVINFQKDTILTSETIIALKFQVPNINKKYALYAVDSYAYNHIKTTKQPTIEDIKSIGPIVLQLGFSQYEKSIVNGVFQERSIGYISTNDLMPLFAKTKKVAVFNSSGKLLVIVKIGDDGLIGVD